jgi:phosphoribosyl 1,2-cyclic phosphate phosphodiesterase
VLNALRQQEHVSHYNLKEAMEIAREVGAEQSYFTHISHQLGLHAEVERILPEGMHLAYDGLTLDV